MLNTSLALLRSVALRSWFALFKDCVKYIFALFRKTPHRFWICQCPEYTRFLNFPGSSVSLWFWIHYASAMLLSLNMSELWIHQGSEYSRVLNMALTLTMPGFWIHQGNRELWMCLNNAFLCLNMLEYARICVNMQQCIWMTFAFHIPNVTSCLLRRVVTYFNSFQPLAIFAENSILTTRLILHVWLSFEYSSAYIESRQPSFEIVLRFYMCYWISNILYFQ